MVGLFQLLFHAGELGQCAIWRAQGSSLEAQLLRSHLQRGKGSVAFLPMACLLIGRVGIKIVGSNRVGIKLLALSLVVSLWIKKYLRL